MAGEIKSHSCPRDMDTFCNCLYFTRGGDGARGRNRKMSELSVGWMVRMFVQDDTWSPTFASSSCQRFADVIYNNHFLDGKYWIQMSAPLLFATNCREQIRNRIWGDGMRGDVRTFILAYLCRSDKWQYKAHCQHWDWAVSLCDSRLAKRCKVQINLSDV